MAQLGIQRKGSVNVDLNIVPFIDLMSCMTAFLLVTAVWIPQTQLPTEPAGRGAGHVQEPERPKVAILVEYDQILVTATPGGEVSQVAAADWATLALRLAELRHPSEGQLVEVAAASSDAHPVPYQSLIAAMDVAVKVGYPDVGVSDPARLTR